MESQKIDDLWVMLLSAYMFGYIKPKIPPKESV